MKKVEGFFMSFLAAMGAFIASDKGIFIEPGAPVSHELTSLQFQDTEHDYAEGQSRRVYGYRGPTNDFTSAD